MSVNCIRVFVFSEQCCCVLFGIDQHFLKSVSPGPKVQKFLIFLCCNVFVLQNLLFFIVIFIGLYGCNLGYI